jgi:enamine deaminase RidA (YjgF/YER057c/UK114 family)
VQAINPEGWPQPRGYSNGIIAEGRVLFIAGQIGWNAKGMLVADAFLEQAVQAMRNVVTVLHEAGGKIEHLARLTWYVTDKEEYLEASHALGEAYRDIFGRHYPAMTLVQVAALLEDHARVEIEATAVLPL